MLGAGRGCLWAFPAGRTRRRYFPALVELRESCEIELHVAHVDHGLRPEARGDAAYVRRLCARWNVPTTVRRVDVDNLRREERLSVEEAARKARHTVFLEEATATGAEAIVLGHTADDHVETVLLSLLRGRGSARAGGDGLSKRNRHSRCPTANGFPSFARCWA